VSEEAEGSRAASYQLVGRDRELAELVGVLSRAGSGSGATAVIRGQAGSGKTTLLKAVTSTARADGWTVVTVQGIETEAELAGAGLLAALTPVRNDLDSVPPAQAEALGAALGWGTTTVPGERFLVGAATLSLLAAAGSRAPLLVAVVKTRFSAICPGAFRATNCCCVVQPSQVSAGPLDNWSRGQLE